jgi:hypothetical protein
MKIEGFGGRDLSSEQAVQYSGCEINLRITPRQSQGLRGTRGKFKGQNAAGGG